MKKQNHLHNFIDDYETETHMHKVCDRCGETLKIQKQNHKPDINGSFTHPSQSGSSSEGETTDAQIERIANMIDPDNTFLDECEEVVKKRFGSSSEGELNLKRKREEIREKLRGFNLWILDEVEEQDKEFIKRLKDIWMLPFYQDGSFNRTAFNEEIDKLAGKDLK